MSPDFIRLVTDLGFGLVLPNYRLSPSARHPEYLADGAAALAWVQRNGHAHGLDTTRVAIGGVSAGAYLAAILLMHPTLLAQGGGDPAPLRGGFFLTGQMTTHFRIVEEKGLRPHAVLSDELAPMYHTRPGLPPLVLLVGDNDIPARLEDNALFAKALRLAGNNDVVHQVIPNREHHEMEGRMPEPGDPAQVALAEFLGKCV